MLTQTKSNQPKLRERKRERERENNKNFIENNIRRKKLKYIYSRKYQIIRVKIKNILENTKLSESCLCIA